MNSEEATKRTVNFTQHNAAMYTDTNPTEKQSSVTVVMSDCFSCEPSKQMPESLDSCSNCPECVKERARQNFKIAERGDKTGSELSSIYQCDKLHEIEYHIEREK